MAVRWRPIPVVPDPYSYGTGFRPPTLRDCSRGFGNPPRRQARRAGFLQLKHYFVRDQWQRNLGPETSTQFNIGGVWELASTACRSVSTTGRSTRPGAGRRLRTRCSTISDSWNEQDVHHRPADPAHPTLPGPIQLVLQGTRIFGDLRTSGIDLFVAVQGSARNRSNFAQSQRNLHRRMAAAAQQRRTSSRRSGAMWFNPSLAGGAIRHIELEP